MPRQRDRVRSADRRTRRHGAPCWARLWLDGLPAVLAVLVTLGAGAAAAQSRPTLEAIEFAMCAKAAADGDSYRPLFCTAECTCDTQEPYAAGTVCNEIAPGDYRVSNNVPYAPSCWGYCSNDLSVRCDSSLGCGSGNSCLFNYGVCSGNSSISCVSDTICTGFGTCIFTPGTCSDQACSTDADCPYVGFTCQNGLCSDATTCTAESSCSLGTVDQIYFTLTGLPTPGSAAAATCDAGPINSNDAAVCIAQVEAALGQACTALP